MRASGLLFSMCLLLGKLGASENVIAIGVVATVEIQTGRLSEDSTILMPSCDNEGLR